MNSRFKYYCLLFLKAYLILLLLSPLLESLFALSEDFQLYNAPQSLAMGDAWTADANGYAALYYNPAGLASLRKKATEVNAVAIDGIIGGSAIGMASKAQSFGVYRLNGVMKSHPGSYAFYNIDMVPSFSLRGFSFALLGSDQYAALSDGTNLDINATEDIIPTVGYAQHFAGNIIQVGIAGKFIERNQLKGSFSHDTLASKNDMSMPALFSEGHGLGVDVGTMITLPNRYLPTLGVVYRDIGNTHFTASHLLNSRAQGAPESIQQSVNAAFSIHPYLSNRVHATFALEYKHFEIGNLPWRKHVHFGVQLEDERSLFFWFGMNGLYPSIGVGLRVKGGNLEVGSYAAEIGDGGTFNSDRRFFFRYTISF